ncbi:MAG TPA: alpha/beta fold hydrolase [Gaiellaceae bacterium]|nr:alpha/beta fold hydrolase [Gaiellaceae bacterium]
MAKRVVLLHSGIGDSRQWRRQVAALGGDFEVVAPDLPGFGREPMPGEPFSFVDFVSGFLPGALVGNSLGGGIALRTALARPELVERLVLVATGFPDWEWSQEIRENWAREEEAFEQGDLDRATELNLEFWVAPEHRDELRPQVLRSLEVEASTPQPELRWPELQPLATLSVPTLVVVGDRDKSDFVDIARHIAGEVQDARLEVIEGAGHVVGVERPDELNALLRDFLED